MIHRRSTIPIAVGVFSICVFSLVGCQPSGVARVPPTVARTPSRPAVLDAQPEELLEALSIHRPLSPPPLRNGRVHVPRDWKELPQGALRWRQSLSGRAVAVGDVLIVRHGEHFLGLDGLTGTELWRQPAPSGLPNPIAVAGCQGMAMLIVAGSIRGIVASTGEIRWSSPFDLLAHSGDIGQPRVHGCNLLHLFYTNAGAQSLMLVDSRTGLQRHLATCAMCLIRGSQAGTGVLLSGAGATRYVRDADGAEFNVPNDTSFVVERAGGPLVVRASNRGDLQASNMDGTPAWPHALSLRPLVRIGDDLIGVAPGALVRLSLLTGRRRWFIPLGEELGALRRGKGTFLRGSRLLLGVSRFLLLVDVQRGEVDALQVAPLNPTGIELGDEVLFVTSHDHVAALRLGREAAPIRERLGLREDIRRSMGRLSGPGVQDRYPNMLPAHVYPSESSAAAQWLRRLGPLALPALLDQLREGTSTQVAGVLTAFDEVPLPLVETVIERSLTDIPGDEAYLLRRSGAEALGFRTLRPDLAEALSDNGILWLRYVRANNMSLQSSGCGPIWEREECGPEARLASAMHATRDLLARNSFHSGPLRRFGAEVVRDAPMGPASIAEARRPCQVDDATLSEDDQIRSAVLAYVFEFGSEEPPTIFVPGIGCNSIATAQGPLPVSSRTRVDGSSSWGLSPPVLTQGFSERRAETLWDDAPIRALVGPTREYMDGTITPHYDVAQIDGTWRVVHYVSIIISESS